VSGDGGKMTFLEHLGELRKRLIYCILAIIGGMLICWFFREELRAFLEAPLYKAWATVDGLPEPEPLRFTSLLEPFIAYLKLSAIGGIFLAAPVILYNLWKFISPGLYPKEKKVALPFVFVSTLLFVGGSAMAYSVVFPIGFSFFLQFAAGGAVVNYEATVEVSTLEREVVAAAPEDVEPEAGGRGPAAAAVPAAARQDGRPGGAAAAGDGRRGKAEAQQGAPADGAVKSSKAWWEIVVDRLASEDCGTFSARVLEDGTVALRYQWEAARCKGAPTISTVRRNGDDLQLEWRELEDAGDGLEIYEALDTPAALGAADYNLAVVTDPEASGKLAPMLMVQDYLSFAVRLLLAFGIVFELPILITFLALAGIVNYKQLLRFSKWFIVLAFVVGAILTPPDVITQILLAAPLIVLYFVSVFVAYLFGPKPD